MKQRLDKFLSEYTGLSRSQAAKVLKQQRVTVNNQYIKDGAFKVSAADQITFDEETLTWITGYQYFLLYKPEGYICSHDDGEYPTVYQFFDYPLSTRLHTAGRLDVDTTGLVLLTDDGQWSHRITSPKYHCEKTYLVTLADPIEDFYVEKCRQGILLKGEKLLTKPAQIEIIDDYNLNLTLIEGKYHQVKRMFAALGNKVVALHRWRIGQIILGEHLTEGEYRSLTKEEVQSFLE